MSFNIKKAGKPAFFLRFNDGKRSDSSIEFRNSQPVNRVQLWFPGSEIPIPFGKSIVKGFEFNLMDSIV